MPYRQQIHDKAVILPPLDARGFGREDLRHRAAIVYSCDVNSLWQGHTGNPSSFAGCFAHATFNIEVHQEQTGDGIGYSGSANVPAGTSRFLSRNADGTAMPLLCRQK